MLARGHGLSGAALGLLGCQLAHAGGATVTPATAFTAAAVCAGAALLPDLDHPEASIAHTFGPVSRIAAVLTNAASARVYARTKTARDEGRDGGHRGVTHTVVFALLAGGVAGVLALWRPGLMTVLFCLLAFALRALVGMRTLNRVFDACWRWALRPLLSKRRHPLLARALRWFLRLDQAWIMLMTGAALASAWAAYALPAGSMSWWVGGCVAVGCWAHCLGDSMTRSGCSWLWPIEIKGKRWYPIGTPRALRFHTGKRGETVVTLALLLPLVIMLAVSTVPGAWASLLALVRAS